MTKALLKRIRGLKCGDVVEVLWLDSGAESGSNSSSLSERLLYGAVHGIVSNPHETLVLGMDVCTDDETSEGNRWGYVLVSCILRMTVLRRAKK